MMIKTSEATPRQLNWLVAEIEGFVQEGDEPWQPGEEPFAFTTAWDQGGPIIERERIFVKPTINKGWRSYQRDPFGNGICHSQYGPTPLIAAMRCYVASKLGDEVDVPEELLK